MGKIAAMLVLAALAVSAAKLVPGISLSKPQIEMTQASMTPPLMYAGIRG